MVLSVSGLVAAFSILTSADRGGLSHDGFYVGLDAALITAAVCNVSDY